MENTITIITAIIIGLVCGFICRFILSGKGYEGSDNHGFAWGFWLGIIGLIVCAAKPNNIQPISTQYYSQPYYGAPPSRGLSYNEKDDGWRCACGAYNKEYETSCHSCGKTYRENRLEKEEKKKTEELEKDRSSLTGQLNEIKKLYDNGLINEEEYNAKRKQILNL